MFVTIFTQPSSPPNMGQGDNWRLRRIAVCQILCTGFRLCLFYPQQVGLNMNTYLYITGWAECEPIFITGWSECEPIFITGWAEC